MYHGHLAHQIRTDERCSQHKAGAARVVAVSLAAVLLSLETAQRESQLAIKAYLKADPALKAKQQRLLSVPGIGRQTVLQVLVLLARWETLTEGTGRAKGLVAYTGLDPKTHDSGSSAHKPARISRMSNRQMRRRLYLAAFGGGACPRWTFARFLWPVGRPRQGQGAFRCGRARPYPFGWTSTCA